MNSKDEKPDRGRWIGVSGVVVVLLVSMVAIRMREVRNAPGQDLSPWALDTAVLNTGTVTRGFPVLATITTEGEITVTGQISGAILKMGPREGVAVKAGDFLARLDTREIEDNIAGLQAKLEAARAEYERHKDELAREEKLLKEGGSSQTALEVHRTAAVAAENNARALERQISALQVRKGYGEVLAPADGVIAARLQESGDVCMPGHPLYRMTVSKGARVRVKLPQSIVEQILPGTVLNLFHGSDTLSVELDRIYPSVDALALGAAEADLVTPPFDLASGARVPGRDILEERRNVLQAPPNAIITGERTRQSRVFKVITRDNREFLETVPVDVVLVGRSGIAVDGALVAGDRVAVAHESVLLELQDGDPVVTNEGGAR